MRITCPHCGNRSLDEFLYYGDATVTRPRAMEGGQASASAMGDFYEYTYQRNNVTGDHQELWYHSAGCHVWLVVTRNLTTHAILSVAAARDVALARASAAATSAPGDA